MRDHFLNLIAVVGGINLGDCFSAISVGLGSQWYLIFVARVEGDLEDFLVAAADGHRLAGGQFDALEQRCLRSVAVHLALDTIIKQSTTRSTREETAFFLKKLLKSSKIK